MIHDKKANDLFELDVVSAHFIESELALQNKVT
jgi:hypothetical protein